MVYRWEFPCLDYSFNVFISWRHKLGCTAGFAIFSFIWFYFRFLILLLLLLYMYTFWFTTFILSHWSPALIILYHACCLLDITTVYFITYCPLPAPVCLCSWHDFQCMLIIQIYRYTCAYPCIPLGIHHTTHWRVLAPLDRMSRFWSLDLVDSPGCWSEMRNGSLDHQQTVWGPILPGPHSALEFSFCDSWVPFVLFILVYLFLFSHLCLSVM